MKRINAKKRTEQARTGKRLYCDSFGVPFAEAQRVALKIPFGMRPIKRPNVLRFMHEQASGVCWLCGSECELTLHHVVSRLDFAGNCVMSCWPCHEAVQHNKERLPEVLRALVENNLATSWIHLIRARGECFPFTTLD